MSQSQPTFTSEYFQQTEQHEFSQPLSENILETLLPVPPLVLQEFVMETFFIPEGRITNLVNSMSEMKPLSALMYYTQHRQALQADISDPRLVEFFNTPKNQNEMLVAMQDKALSQGTSQEQFDSAFEKAQDSYHMIEDELDFIDRKYQEGYGYKSENDEVTLQRLLDSSLRGYVHRIQSLTTTFRQPELDL